MPFSLHRVLGVNPKPKAQTAPAIPDSPTVSSTSDTLETTPRKKQHRVGLWSVHFGFTPWKPVPTPGPRAHGASDAMQAVGKGHDPQQHHVPNRPIAIRRDAEAMEQQGYSFVSASPVDDTNRLQSLTYEKNRDVWQIVVGLSNFAQREKIKQMRSMGYQLVGSYDLDGFNTVLTFRYNPQAEAHT